MDLVTTLSRAFSAAADGDLRGILACVLFASGVACVGSFISQLRTARWPSVEGRLLTASIDVASGGRPAISDQRYIDSVRYEYVVDGRRYEGDRLSPWQAVASHNARAVLKSRLAGLEPGRPVRVYYNPRRPAKAFLKPSGGLGRLVTLAIAVALMWVPFAMFGR